MDLKTYFCPALIHQSWAARGRRVLSMLTALSQTGLNRTGTRCGAQLLASCCDHIRSPRSSWRLHCTASSMQTDPGQLWSKVEAAYDAAQQSGASSRTATSLRRQEDGGVTFYTRQALSLQKKPSSG